MMMQFCGKTIKFASMQLKRHESGREGDNPVETTLDSVRINHAAPNRSLEHLLVAGWETRPGLLGIGVITIRAIYRILVPDGVGLSDIVV